jgi:putative tryptophan/tyrosine transport system substrate-binding protein
MIRRREFVSLLGGAAVAWPTTAWAQQAPWPVVGFLSAGTPESAAGELAAFHQGLREAGYVEGRNVTIDYRWSGQQHDLMLALTADLVRRKVAVIYASGGTAVAKAAKAATTSIPVVFVTGGDPIKLGLVGSFNRPSDNVTGVTFFSNMLAAKRLALLHDLVPGAPTITVLMNPSNPNANLDLDDIQLAAGTLGLQLELLRATNEREIDAAFDAMTQNLPGAVFIAADAYFTTRRNQIVAHVASLRKPAIYPRQEYVVAGGLISYATQVLEGYRLSGTYVGCILKGEKPGDLPVQQPTKIDLAINLKTARAIGLHVPDRLLALADEVIE